MFPVTGSFAERSVKQRCPVFDASVSNPASFGETTRLTVCVPVRLDGVDVP